MFGIGPMELVVIVVVALLIFGPQRLPEFARTLGKGLAEFRRASNDLRQSLALDELQNDLRKTMNQATSPPPAVSRPAQAGDTLPPGPGVGTTGPTTGVTSASESDSAPAETPPWKSHSGQLPEGGDHDHHDPSPGAEAIPDVPTRLAAADPGLGNVPVGGADPAETRRG